jgi:hypothetical protein
MLHRIGHEMVAAKKNPVTGIVTDVDAEMTAYRTAMQNATAPAWRPEPNTTIVGTVIGMNMRESGYGPYPMITYRLDTGEVINLHAFHTLIRNSLAEAKTDIGKRQFVTYLGIQEKNNATAEEKEKGLDKYHMYFVLDANDLNNAPLEGKSEDFAF